MKPLTLTRNQNGAWGVRALDGMDSFICALMLVPAMRDLLAASVGVGGESFCTAPPPRRPADWWWRALLFLWARAFPASVPSEVPVALTSVAFILGLLLMPWGEETRGKPPPD